MCPEERFPRGPGRPKFDQREKRRKTTAIANIVNNVRASKWAVNYIFIGARGEVHKSLVLTEFIASRRILIRIHRCDFYEFTTDDRVSYTVGNGEDFSRRRAHEIVRWGNFPCFLFLA